MFGGVGIDLRRAGMRGDSAVIDVTSMFGGVDFKVPPNWIVVGQIVAVFGGFGNKRTATPAVAGRLDAVLDAGGALVALVNRRQVLAGAAAIAGAPLFGTLDADGRERLTWAQRHPRRVDQAAVDSLAGVLAAQRRADDALGCRATGTAPQRA